MSVFDDPRYLSEGIRKRMERVVIKFRPPSWSEALTKLQQLQSWLLEAERAAKS